MPVYICIDCNFSSKLKGDFKRHLLTKKHTNMIKNPPLIQNEPKMNQNEPKMNQNEPKMNQLKMVNTNINIIDNKLHKCCYCDELFNTIPSKRRHELHRCKSNTNIKNKYIEKLENKVAKMSNKISNINNIQNNIDNINNVSNVHNIQINSYGKEDISHISDSFKTEMLKIPYGAIPQMIEVIHFNNKKPENKNVIIPNLNKNIIKVKSGEKWIYKNKDDLLKDMIDSKYLMLDDHFDLVVNGEKLSNHNKQNYMSFRDNYDKGDKFLINDIKNECELMILNNRDV